MRRTLIAIGGVAVAATVGGAASTPGPLRVGPGHPYARPEAALAAAVPGTVIEVYPLADGAPYPQVALCVTVPRCTLRARPAHPGERVVFDGAGFDYSGVGRVPRAIVQFQPGADGGRCEGFELRGARNRAHNGAGVRVAGANHVVVADCDLHDNDMGAMSNGDGTLARGVDQLFLRCRLHRNGSAADPGRNHNLYLGGAGVTLRACEVSHSTTGHNVKSRAHVTRVEYCYVHDSGNREFDLVDAAETALPGSHAVLLGNVIVKAPAMAGNRAVIHFGQDGGGAHDGTCYVVHNTIVTPYVSPVVQLSAPGARAHLVSNLVWDDGAGPAHAVLAAASHGAARAHVTGRANWLAAGFAPLDGTGCDPAAQILAPRGAVPGFADPARADYRLAAPAAGLVDAGVPIAALGLPGVPGATAPVPDGARQYRHPCADTARPDDGHPDCGAYERG